MKLKTLKDIDLSKKTVLYRSPYDIGTKEKDGKFIIKDDSRIKATIPTINYLLENECKIIILTWVGRPDGQVEEKLRTTPHAKALSEMIGKEVKKVDECVGPEVEKAVSELGYGELLMLENTRFHKEEDGNDPEFAKKLASLGEVVVYDGFPQAHREHASTTGIIKLLPSVAGLYFEKEYESLKKLIDNPDHPFTVIIGGAKISDKVDAVNNLYDKADTFLLGGGPANVFLKAEGKEIADSYIEDVFVDSAKKENKDWVQFAKELKEREGSSDEKIIIPKDIVIGNNVKEPTESRKVAVTDANDLVPQGWAALDIGEKTMEAYTEIIRQSKTVFWNGPVGMFEAEGFSEGTKAIAKAMESCEGTTIVAGGDTIEAAIKFCDVNKLSHISLAGGASLEMLAGKKLPVVELLLE